MKCKYKRCENCPDPILLETVAGEISRASTIKSTHVWPHNGGLDEQDVGDYEWFAFIDGCIAKAETKIAEDHRTKLQELESRSRVNA